MKSLLEAAIAIIVVYLLLEYFKNNESSSAGTLGGGSAVAGTTAGSPKSGCCCGGGGASAASKAPGLNQHPIGVIGYNPITNIGFGTVPVSMPIQSVPPSPAPVPRINYQINA